MNPMPNYANIGEYPAHSMPEAFYEKGLKLIQAEKRAYKKAREAGADVKLWKAWERASRRLTEHENAHSTA
jgi:hypothetical protein